MIRTVSATCRRGSRFPPVGAVCRAGIRRRHRRVVRREGSDLGPRCPLVDHLAAPLPPGPTQSFSLHGQTRRAPQRCQRTGRPPIGPVPPRAARDGSSRDASPMYFARRARICRRPATDEAEIPDSRAPRCRGKKPWQPPARDPPGRGNRPRGPRDCGMGRRRTGARRPTNRKSLPPEREYRLVGGLAAGLESARRA